MPDFYDAEVSKKLGEDLNEILFDADVDEKVARFLADLNIRKVEAFADLPDSKAEIIDVVGRPAGLDPQNKVACQPLVTAWRRAEADAKALLEARAKGEDTDKDVPLSYEQRQRLDAQAFAYYKFSWPPAWQAASSLIGKLKRFLDKQTDFVPRLETDVRSILEKKANPLFEICLSQKGSVQTQPKDGYSPIQGLWKLRERHFLLMLAYNEAAYPEFASASLTVLFEYHQWIAAGAD